MLDQLGWMLDVGINRGRCDAHPPLARSENGCGGWDQAIVCTYI
jgi:hypothetical protein